MIKINALYWFLLPLLRKPGEEAWLQPVIMDFPYVRVKNMNCPYI